MSAKLSISRVCVTWNALITRHLFEYLLIESGPQVLRIASAFAQHSSQPGGDVAQPLGWWTLRLELALDNVHTWTKEHSLALAFIIRRCPNLVCFSTAFCTADPQVFYCSPVIDSLAESTNVKRVELRTDLSSLRNTSMALSKSLEMIWLVPCRRLSEDPNPWVCRLPNLHTFVSHFQFGRTLDHMELPSLRTLVVDDGCDRTSAINKNGHCLQYLSVSDISITLPLLSTCQNLSTLAINFHEVTLANFSILFKDMSFSNVQRLIIEGHSDVDLSRRFFTKLARRNDPLRNNLVSFACAKTFPKLRNVRLVLPLSFESISCNPSAISNWHSTWSPWFDACNKRGIIVETAYGSEQWSIDKWKPFHVA
ncbi:hypothetical protein AX17_003895 [Amanita inopinata Kibby_2008]|nr:hypothetical protein AX17_003895 [Amanita inopinata Kibby_2008]